MTSKNEFNNALIRTAAAASDYRAQSNRIHSEHMRRKFKEGEADCDIYNEFVRGHGREIEERSVETLGRIQIKASFGGNTVCGHVRHTFKIDGKRASRADVEALLA